MVSTCCGQIHVNGLVFATCRQISLTLIGVAYMAGSKSSKAAAENFTLQESAVSALEDACG